MCLVLHLIAVAVTINRSMQGHQQGRVNMPIAATIMFLENVLRSNLGLFLLICTFVYFYKACIKSSELVGYRLGTMSVFEVSQTGGIRNVKEKLNFVGHAKPITDIIINSDIRKSCLAILFVVYFLFMARVQIK